MAGLNNIVILVSSPTEKNTDTFGITKKSGEHETYRKIFCNDKSTSYNEFFMARQAGIDTQIRLEILACEYNKEDTVIFEGKRYKVVRAHKNKNGNLIELSLTDLPKRGGSVGGI